MLGWRSLSLQRTEPWCCTPCTTSSYTLWPTVLGSAERTPLILRYACCTHGRSAAPLPRMPTHGTHLEKVKDAQEIVLARGAEVCRDAHQGWAPMNVLILVGLKQRRGSCHKLLHRHTAGIHPAQVGARRDKDETGHGSEEEQDTRVNCSHKRSTAWGTSG